MCGEDLNWFFNQWFLTETPLLVIDYEYDADNKQQIVKLEQIQDGPQHQFIDYRFMWTYMKIIADAI